MSERRKEADSKSNFIPSPLSFSLSPHYVQGFHLMSVSPDIADIDPRHFLIKEPM